MEWKFPINPVAASRPRITSGKNGRQHAYYVGPYKRFRLEIIDILESIFDGDYPKYNSLLAVSLELYATKPKKTKLSVPKWDIDNGIKAVFDALNKKLWEDDTQIVSVYATKQWAEDGEEGYFIVGVNPL